MHSLLQGADNSSCNQRHSFCFLLFLGLSLLFDFVILRVVVVLLCLCLPLSRGFLGLLFLFLLYHSFGFDSIYLGYQRCLLCVVFFLVEFDLLLNLLPRGFRGRDGLLSYFNLDGLATLSGRCGSRFDGNRLDYLVF